VGAAACLPEPRPTVEGWVTARRDAVAYVDDFKLLMIATLVVIPLLIVFKKPAGSGADHTVVVE
jgi:DHA2 family multidrug resistance protein